MIYVTGDTHGDFSRFNEKDFPQMKYLTKNDYVIVTGDFGGVWESKGSEEYKDQEKQLNKLSKLPFNILFVDGNHENFKELKKYEKEKWHGGKAQFIRKNVIHLCRGYVFDIDGKSIFSFGGARSIDIGDGILNPKDFDSVEDFCEERLNWIYAHKNFRVNGISWWKQEMPNEKEMNRGLENLTKYDNRVDYIITHDAPYSILRELYGNSQLLLRENNLHSYFDNIYRNVDFDRWFFGHHHREGDIPGRNFTCMFQGFQPISLEMEREQIPEYHPSIYDEVDFELF